MASQKYARPADDVSPSATWSLASGTAVAGYPVTRLGNRNPGQPFKATGTSATMRATFGSAQTLVAIAIINHNLAGASSVVLTSASGLSQAIAIPANSGGFCVCPVLDFSAASSVQRTSTQFDLAVTGTVLGNVAIGEVLLLTALRDLRWIWGLKRRPKRLIKTPGQSFSGSLLQYNKRVRVYQFSGRTELKTEQVAMATLEEEAQGELFAWLLWPDITINQAHYVKFLPGTFEQVFRAFGSTESALDLEEVSAGPPLFP